MITPRKSAVVPNVSECEKICLLIKNMSTPANPLLSGLSITTLSDSNSSSTESATENALTKLLDSAMLNAAKESSPEVEGKPNSNTNSTSPNSQSSPEFNFTARKTINDNIYTIEELLALKGAGNSTINDQLPAKDFWFGNKKQWTSGQEHNHANNESKRKPRNRREPKKKVLDEEPNWNAEFNDSVKLEMGTTVEDFERWKQAQRKGSEPQSLIPQPDNAVDNFFSFGKPSEAVDKMSTDTGSKSSRFSSFFTSPPQSNSPRPTTQVNPPPGLVSTTTGGSMSTAGPQPPLPQDTIDNSSRFFNHEPEPTNKSNMAQFLPNMIPTSLQNGMMPPPPGLPFNMPPNYNPQANDSFFRSLLTKSEVEGTGTNRPNLQAPFHNQQPVQNPNSQNFQMPQWTFDNGVPGPPGFPPQGMFPPNMQFPPSNHNMAPPGLMRRPESQLQNFQGPTNTGK